MNRDASLALRPELNRGVFVFYGVLNDWAPEENRSDQVHRYRSPFGAGGKGGCF